MYNLRSALSTKSLRPILVSALSGVAFAAVLAPGANASLISIELSEPGFGTEVIPGGGSSFFFGTGPIGFGTFLFNNINGTGNSTNLPLPNLLFSNSMDTSSSIAGVLTIDVTAQDITAPLGSNVSFLSGFTTTVLNGGITITEQTFLDAGNGQFALTTPLSLATFSGIGANGVALTAAANTGIGPSYSITEQFVITATGAGSANSTISVSAAVPEPSTWAMMLIGFAGLGFFACRRQRRSRGFSKLAHAA